MKIEQLNYRDVESIAVLADTDDVHQALFITQGGVRLTITEDSDGAVSIFGDPIGRDFIARLSQHEVYVSSVQVRVARLRGERITPKELAVEQEGR